MERNWLIRTSQNQILGPVAKQKLLEFVQKGALGMMDEVSSGNGYWFSLKEKDLVDKYLHGDLPQGYNPISESKSVVARKENPDKTTSINNAPVNNSTRVIKLDDLKKSNQAEPSDLTMVRKAPTAAQLADTKLPNQDDLEFPDIALISNSVNEAFKGGDLELQASLTSAKIPMPIPKPSHAISQTEHLDVKAEKPLEEVVLPADDDLAFPELDDPKTSPKIDKGKVDLSHQYTRTVALDVEQAAEVLPLEDEGDTLSFEVPEIKKAKILLDEEVAKSFDNATKPDAPLSLNRSLKLGGSEVSVKKDRPQPAAATLSAPGTATATTDDKKLLHDRKTKSSVAKGAALRDPTRENHPKDAEALTTKRNDNYIFFILIILILIIVAVFFYFKEILNKPLPV